MLIQSVTITCCAFDLAKCDRDYEAELELEVATQHPIPGQLSSLLSLCKLLFCQTHVDVLKQQAWHIGPCFCQLGHKCVPQHFCY